MYRQLNPEQRAQILAYKTAGYSVRKIAKIFKVSTSTVSYTIKKKTKDGTFLHKRTNGRKSKCNTHVKSLILKEITNNGKKSTRKLAKRMSKIANETFSHTSMKNYLNNMNIFSYNIRKKPDLEPYHVIARYEASKEWLMIPENDIKKIIFSDELKFNR